MTTPDLTAMALQSLQKIQVRLLPIKPLTGTSWNVGEQAMVDAEITNTTGVPLRDVVVETMIWGSAASYSGFLGIWDGNGATISSLEPGETWTDHIALLAGKSADSFSLLVTITAEVVPFAGFTPVHATYTVQAPP